ncbi:MAG: MBL fold metallo-hydrolase [Edaphobacter sp.]|uniref:MBL fold metallo-hydrolase n=1 Tax=Edaphobacter sp. TaxID=1934404 RepID=UPI00238DCA5A|nr:MBL fold metallo-hydrolase [Edaphobacter sp.]MDE1177268.1 MBL fold metallo-hydrolase [Edaphobacter sp.]
MSLEDVAAERRTFLRRAERTEKKYLNPVPTSVGGWRTLRDALPEYLRNKEEKFPKTPLGPFRTDAAIYETPSASGLRVTWMGHSSTLIEIDGVRVLTDPVWDERASPLRWAGPKRFFAPPLPLEAMPKLDVVLISHDHYDHLGESTIRKLARLGHLRETEWITSLGVGEVLEQYGVAKRRIQELDWTQSCNVSASSGELEITAVPTRHFSGRSMFNRFETLWSAFVLKGRQHKVYFGADSGWWPGFAEIGAEYGPFDLTMLEIGAYNDLWKEIHLGPDGAARAFLDLGDKGLMMPIHWGLFDLALHGWRQPIERMLEVSAETGIQLWSPAPGQPSDVFAGTPLQSDWWR